MKPAILFNTNRYAPCTVRLVNELLLPSFSTLLAMAGFALTGAISPGPVSVLALRHGNHSSRQQTLSYVLGASISYMLVVACMGWLSTQGLRQVPDLAQQAQWLCAAYLLWLAWRLARAPAASVRPESAFTTAPQLWQVFGQGAAIQIINPKAWLFALSAVGLFVVPHSAQSGAHLAMLCAVSAVACLLGVGAWALLGRVLVQWLSTPQRQQRLQQALALLLIACVLAMLA